MMAILISSHIFFFIIKNDCYLSYLGAKAREPLAEEVYTERVKGRDQNVQAQVELCSVDEQRLIDVLTRHVIGIL